MKSIIDHKQILNKFKRKLLARFKDDLISLVLFGSVARGTAKKESDIDMLIILKDAPDSYYERLKPVVDIELEMRKDVEGIPPIFSSMILSLDEAKQNRDISKDAQEQAVQKVLRIYSPDMLHNNETFHQFLVEKVKIPYQQDGYERSYEVALIDFINPSNNEFLVVNQYMIIENNQNKRPDLLLFINGIPIVLFELKNAADENATIRKAFIGHRLRNDIVSTYIVL